MAIINRGTTEKSVLSTCLNNLDKSWVSYVARAGGNEPETLFSDNRNMAVFSCLNRMINEGQSPSIPQVIDILDSKHENLFEDGSEDYVLGVQLAPTLDREMMDSSLESLIEARSQRRILRQAEVLVQDLNDPTIDVSSSDAVERLDEIIKTTDVSQNVQTFAEIAQAILDSPAPMWTQPTNIKPLDDALGGRGYESGTLTVVAARPKVGKTVFMNDSIYRTIEAGNYPLVFNYETKKVEFMAKMIARHIKDKDLGWGKIKGYISGDENTFLTADQKKAIDAGIQWSLDQNWKVIFDKSTKMSDFIGIVKQVRTEIPEEQNIVVFIDYLQLMVEDNSQAVSIIADLTRTLKLIASSEEVAVVLLSQLNRGAGDERPRVWHMRGSGAIEQDADVVLLLDTPSRRRKPEDDEEGSSMPSIDRNILEIDGTTSRLSTGEDMRLFIDGGCQLIEEEEIAKKQGRVALDIPMSDIIVGDPPSD